jgi:hypothetical protein
LEVEGANLNIVPFPTLAREFIPEHYARGTRMHFREVDGLSFAADLGEGLSLHGPTKIGCAIGECWAAEQGEQYTHEERGPCSAGSGAICFPDHGQHPRTVVLPTSKQSSCQDIIINKKQVSNDKSRSCTLRLIVLCLLHIGGQVKAAGSPERYATHCYYRNKKKNRVFVPGL